MDYDLIHAFIGYLGSALIIASLAMKSILRLRWIGLAGAATFVAYGYLIGAWPIVWTNAVIVLIHIHFLRRARKTEEFFKLLEIRPDSRYLDHFIAYYAEDIEATWPGFEYRPGPDVHALFILRDLVPAGLLVAREVGDAALEVHLEYAIPGFRDFKIGRYLYERGGLRSRGYERATARPGGHRAIGYLSRMGFVPPDADDDAWTRELG